MIEKIELKNFQSHKHSKLKLDPGVNIIIGSSDSGKSAIIRALRWLVWNRPLGDAFRSNWGGDTSILIKTPDNIIERFKGKGGDKYTLFHDDEFELIELKAFGTDVPEEIKQALNISEINIQNQHDNSFLLSETSGEVSRHFNKIANIDQIDSSLAIVKRWISDLTKEKENQESNIEDYENQLENFKYLDKFEAEIEVLESIENEKNLIANKLTALSKLIINLENVEKEIADSSKILIIENDVINIIKSYKEKTNLIKEYKILKNSIQSIFSIFKEIKELNKLISNEKEIEEILNLYDDISNIEKKYSQFQKIINSINTNEKEIKNNQEKLKKLEEKWHENSPETCPLCGKSLL